MTDTQDRLKIPCENNTRPVNLLLHLMLERCTEVLFKKKELVQVTLIEFTALSQT